MKKTIHFVPRARNACLLRKLLLIMRLTIFLLLFALIQVMGVESYSQETKISLNFKSTSLKDVLEFIEDESNFYFLYSAAMIDVDRKVDVNIENGNITEVLNKVLKNTGIRYVIKGRQILLAARNKPDVFGENVQQQKSVSGKVTDSSGAALPGVTVVIKGTAKGTITDVNGNYSVNAIEPAGVLMFSFMGMKTQEISVSGKTTINVILAEESIGLEEVVAVGYGTQRKATLTGAISNINSAEIKVSTQSNLTNTMSGKLPGLRVVQRTSEPGRYENYFDIRGYGSPLVVVDGIEREDYSKIDPNEVESISILKDASAAVYGVKAADGVVLITTKKGGATKAKFNYSGTYGWANVTRTPEVGNAVDWMTLTNEQIQNDNIVKRTNKALSFSAEDIEQYANGTKKSTDWKNLALRDYAPQQQHNLNVNGGTD
jgi:TonB-dependent SusC/RagA subfamily outer membrane receptor